VHTVSPDGLRTGGPEPHDSIPHPLSITPHVNPFCWQLVVGMQLCITHWWSVVLHVSIGGQMVPQLSVPPHPSPPVPQVHPSWPHVFGTHLHLKFVSQMSFVPAQCPHWRMPPHPFEGVPHSAPSCTHVFATHTPGPHL
jgi:hypothetical protein